MNGGSQVKLSLLKSQLNTRGVSVTTLTLLHYSDGMDSNDVKIDECKVNCMLT